MRWWSTPASDASTQTGLASWAFPKGPLWGRLHKGEPVTLPTAGPWARSDLVGAPRRGRALVYTGDTRPHLAVIEAARGADLLIHEATFGGDEAGSGEGDRPLDGCGGRPGGGGGRRPPAGADPHQLALQP